MKGDGVGVGLKKYVLFVVLVLCCDVGVVGVEGVFGVDDLFVGCVYYFVGGKVGLWC